MSYSASLSAYCWILSLTACEAFTAPQGAYRVEPPAFFRDHWHRMEQCSGHTGNIDRVTWFAVPGSHFVSPDGQLRSGAWVSPHTIYLTESALREPLWGVPSVVAPHEILHDLLQNSDHGPVFYSCRVMSSP